MARILEARNNPRVKEHAPKSSSQQLIVGNFVCAQVKQQHFGTFPLGEVNIAHAAQLEPIACRQALTIHRQSPPCQMHIGKAASGQGQALGFIP